VFPKVFQSV